MRLRTTYGTDNHREHPGFRGGGEEDEPRTLPLTHHAGVANDCCFPFFIDDVLGCNVLCELLCVLVRTRGVEIVAGSRIVQRHVQGPALAFLRTLDSLQGRAW